jgi:hypothetical protein
MKRHPSRWFSLVAVIAAGIILAACSSTPKPDVDYKSDYNFMNVKKIAFYKFSGDVTGDNPLQLSDFQKERIDEALQYALEIKGMQIVDNPEEADMLISWHLATQDKTDVRTYQTPAYGAYGGYGRYNRYAGYNCWNCMPTQTEVSVQNYTEGTFIVDMIDPAMRKSVWRSVTQSRLKGKHETDQGKYNEAAIRIMEGFPP